MPWLHASVLAAGGEIHGGVVVASQDDVHDLAEKHHANVVVNAMGISGGVVDGDVECFGVRGLLVAVHAPWLQAAVGDPDSPSPEGEAYIIPRGNGSANKQRQRIMPTPVVLFLCC